MKAFKIDAEKRTIEEIDLAYEVQGIEAIYEAGGFDCFDSVRINAMGDRIYVDDAGLIREPPNEFFFALKNYDSPLAGNGVVLGCGQDGETQDARIKLSDLKQRIVFLRHVGGGVLERYEN